jgi:hypothetical protein
MSEHTDVTALDVLNTLQFVNKIEKETRRLYSDNKHVILIKEKINKIKKLTDRIAINHNFIKTVKFYWKLKKPHMVKKNQRILINSKEWYKKKNEITKQFFTNTEKKFEKVYPNKMSYILKFKKPIDCHYFDDNLRKYYNIDPLIRHIEDLNLKELDSIPSLHECYKTVKIDNEFINSIPIDLNEIYNTYFTDEEKKILDKF